MTSTDALVPQASATTGVPVGYAEKAMASIMQLHADLMEEKDRRVELYRKLMEREQTIAELRLYVRALEEKLGRLGEAAPINGPFASQRETAHSAGEGAEAKGAAVPPQPVRPPSLEALPRRPPVPPQVGAKAKVDGWRSW